MTHTYLRAPQAGLLAVAVSIAFWASGAPAGAAEKTGQDRQAPRRIVFVGDSITDGNSYPLLLRQALAEAGQPVPVCINAGVAGDTAKGMRQRLQRDVLAYHPTLVTLSVGINDVLRKVTPADYETDVTAIAEKLKAWRVPMVLLTTSILGPRNAEADRRLAAYNAILHRLAKRHGYPVAEVNRLMQQARSAGQNVLEEDQVHPNYQGHRLMTRALLDALGYPKVAVPRTMKVSLMPGLLRDWRLRAAPEKQPALDERTVRTLKPDDSWKAYHLPEDKPQSAWWFDQERKRGFALSLERLLGKAKGYQGVASLESAKERQVYFNTGAQLQAVWLNGKKIYQSHGWTGWHAGKERVPARLQAGRNVIVIETGSAFFLSVTEDNTW